MCFSKIENVLLVDFDKKWEWGDAVEPKEEF